MPSVPARVESSVVSASPFDMAPAEFKAAVDRRIENVKTLLQALESILEPKLHYGKIHLKGRNECRDGNDCKNPYHWSKNVLFKPGAEKINQFLGLTPRYRPLTDEERRDYGIAAADQIVVKCELLSGSGAVCSEGLGARSLDPRDGAHALNKALKMAEKSARINATIQLGLSDCYTQDLDDMFPGQAAPEKDLSPDLQRSLDEATVKRLETTLKHVPEKMTDEDHRKLAEAKARLAISKPADGSGHSGNGPTGESPSAPRTSGPSGSGAAPSAGECECGSPLEHRTSKKGKAFVTCKLQYAAKWGGDAAAKKTLEDIEADRERHGLPPLQHTYKARG